MLQDCLRLNNQHVGACRDMIRYYQAAGDSQMVEQYRALLKSIEDTTPAK